MTSDARARGPQEASTEFAAWKAIYGRAYSSAKHEDERFAHYLATLRNLAANSDPFSSYAPGQFADWTPAELASLLGARPWPGPRPISFPSASAGGGADMSSDSPGVLGTRAVAVKGTSNSYSTYAAANCPFPFSCYPAALDWTNVTVGGVPVVTPVRAAAATQLLPACARMRADACPRRPPVTGDEPG